MSLLDDRAEHWIAQLELAMIGGCPWDVAWVLSQVEAADLPEPAVDARVQRALLMAVKARLDADTSFNQRFAASPDWRPLHQLLVAARVRELTSVRIVKRGRSSGVGYAIHELAASYYGRQVLDGLGINRRRTVLDQAELTKVRVELLKIKVVLPEAVEPTFTERFFDAEDG